MVAGARNMVASLSPAHDGAATTLMQLFHEELLRSAGTTDALAFARWPLAAMDRANALAVLGAHQLHAGTDRSPIRFHRLLPTLWSGLTMESTQFIRALGSVWGDGYWVTWQPSVRHRLGDIGVIEGPALVPITNLTEKGIDSPGSIAETRDDLVWRSESGVDVSFSISGETAPELSAVVQGGGRALVQFSGENGLLVAYHGLAETRLLNQPALAQEMLRRYWLAAWTSINA